MLIKNRVKGIKGENFPFIRQTTPRPPYGARCLAPLGFCGICGWVRDNAPFGYDSALGRHDRVRY